MPSRKSNFFFTEIKSTTARKIEVHHAGAARNASHPEENLTFHYWSEKLGELYS